MREASPDCDPGWVHENITVGDHGHSTSLDPEVVERLVERIKNAEAR